MRYYEYTFTLNTASEGACERETAIDILSAMLADVGFEAFETVGEGLKSYIQTTLSDNDALQDMLACFPLPDWDIRYEQREAEYANWNEQWEREGFQPIVIGTELCIHDQLHTTLPGTDEPLPRTRHELIVSPRLAFGSGTHPTTRQLLEVLLGLDLQGLHIIDAGCGTGILGMLCLLKNADKVSAYDIDEWSVNNTRENVELNHLHGLNVWLGDASVLPQVTLQEGKADLLIANINRNILLQDMPAFCEALKPTASRLLLSGFYVSDIPYLQEKAEELGFKETSRSCRDDWAVLIFEKGK